MSSVIDLTSRKRPYSPSQSKLVPPAAPLLAAAAPTRPPKAPRLYHQFAAGSADFQLMVKWAEGKAAAPMDREHWDWFVDMGVLMAPLVGPGKRGRTNTWLDVVRRVPTKGREGQIRDGTDLHRVLTAGALWQRPKDRAKYTAPDVSLEERLLLVVALISRSEQIELDIPQRHCFMSRSSFPPKASWPGCKAAQPSDASTQTTSPTTPAPTQTPTPVAAPPGTTPAAAAAAAAQTTSATPDMQQPPPASCDIGATDNSTSGC
ncbi:hypothetical protein Pelo_19392 [Pelomyxa schiedti]|nr:hypothetical protein Pelo_19392 [Pelomyxa schiedti]